MNFLLQRLNLTEYAVDAKHKSDQVADKMPLQAPQMPQDNVSWIEDMVLGLKGTWKGMKISTKEMFKDFKKIWRYLMKRGFAGFILGLVIDGLIYAFHWITNIIS